MALALAWVPLACNAITGLDQYAQCASCENDVATSAGGDGSPSRDGRSDADARAGGGDADSTVGADARGWDAEAGAGDEDAIARESDTGGDGGVGGGDGAAGGDAQNLEAGDASEEGTESVGLIAFYPFDESSGNSSADTSGNGQAATLFGGATFSAGIQGNAVTLNGSNQYVSLPAGIAKNLTSFSICAWVNLNSAPTHVHIFDFGTGTTTYMFLSPHSGAATLQFAISNNSSAGEQTIDGALLATGSWQHTCVTSDGSSGTLYIAGVSIAQNTAMTLSPASLGATTQNWLGRSEFTSDPYLNGRLDNFRIYQRTLSAAEVQYLYTQHL